MSIIFTNDIAVDLGNQNSILDEYQARLSFDSITKVWLNLQNECSRLLSFGEDTHFEQYRGINVLGEIEPNEDFLSHRRLSNKRRSGKTKGLCNGINCPKDSNIQFPNRRLDDWRFNEYYTENRLEECSQTLLELLQKGNPTFFANLTEVQLAFTSEATFDDFVPCDTNECVIQFEAMSEILFEFGTSIGHEFNPEIFGSECSWDYVNCDVETDIITSLIFFNKDISSSIPTSIGLLNKLEWFDAPNANLTSSIPLDLFSITSLKGLTVPGNNLSGTIPAEIGALKNLTNINLTGNRFTGKIPTNIGLLENLETLDLSGNTLSGTVPSELAQLKNLKNLNLRGNKYLSGTIPSSLCPIAELEDNAVACSNTSESLSTTALTTNSPSGYPALTTNPPSGYPSSQPNTNVTTFDFTQKNIIIVASAFIGVMLVSFCAGRAIAKRGKK